MDIISNVMQPIRWGLGISLIALSSNASSLRLDAGVVLDDAAGIAYVADPAGFIQAIDISNGQTRWISNERGLPLDLSEQRLLALGTVEQFGLAMLLILDPASGSNVDRVAFDLPEWVSAELVAKPQRRFTVSTQAHSDGVRLYWDYQSRPLRGALIVDPDAPLESDVGRRQMSGAVDISLGTRGSYALPVRHAYTAPTTASPNLAANERLPGLQGQQFRAADDQHVLVSRAVDNDPFGTINHWDIHQRQGGTLLGQLESHYALAPFVVRGDLLIYRSQPISIQTTSDQMLEHGPQLRAYDLKRQRQLWSVDVLDLEYRGPMPP